MLNVTPQRSPEAAKTYFAKSDYYSEGQEIVGNWGGKGAVLLGLFGQVEKEAFDKLCDNIHPHTGEQLTAITRGNRRVGYDFTWSAPKSVSVVHALTGDERIADAFRASIKDTMGEMEAEMQTRVRKGWQQRDRTTGNLVWAEFTHLTSRPVNGVPCPQLHVHAFAFNATYDNVEERWKAGQFAKLKGDGYYWQAVQQARFANRLQELGYAIRKTKDAFEIEQVPDSVKAKFSERTKQIERVAAELGIIDPKVKATLGAKTREAKDDIILYPELIERWDKQLTPDERKAIHSAAGAPKTVAYQDAEHVRFAVDHAFERSSVMDKRRLLTLALKHGVGEVSPEGVRDKADRLGLLNRHIDGHEMVTTREVLAEENRMLGFAVAGKGSCKPLGNENGRWQDELRETQLSGEQRAAAAHLLTSPDRIMILRGVAGAGKTTLTKHVVKQIEAAGKSVVMLAPSTQASRGVLRDEGFDAADTLSQFMKNKEMQSGAAGGVIWLDESGLVGSKTMTSLFELANRLDARVVLVGDKRQMSPVERGSALRVLEELGGLPIAQLTDIRRQSGRYKEAVHLLSDGKAIEGLAQLERLGWVKEMPTEDRYGPLAADYVAKFDGCEHPDKDILIVSPTHAEAAKITEAVRHRLKDWGIMKGKEREFTRLVPLQWTQAQKADRDGYVGSEILQLHRNSGEFKAGDRVTADVAFASSRPPDAKNFGAFARATIQLVKGDLLRITNNGHTLDGKHKLNNGAVYSVDGFTPAGDVKLGNGWVVDKNFGHWDWGYVSTAQAAQGRTVQHVLISQTAASYPAGSRESFYVAVSRGQRSATIYTDDKEELREAVARSHPRMSATELVGNSKPQVWDRIRESSLRLQRSLLVAASEASRDLKRVRQPELSHDR
jgi:conjugative relaxase-like TrwC/TraI family protein